MSQVIRPIRRLRPWVGAPLRVSQKKNQPNLGVRVYEPIRACEVLPRRHLHGQAIFLDDNLPSNACPAGPRRQTMVFQPLRRRAYVASTLPPTCGASLVGLTVNAGVKVIRRDDHHRGLFARVSPPRPSVFFPPASQRSVAVIRRDDYHRGEALLVHPPRPRVFFPGVWFYDPLVVRRDDWHRGFWLPVYAANLANNQQRPRRARVAVVRRDDHRPGFVARSGRGRQLVIHPIKDIHVKVIRWESWEAVAASRQPRFVWTTFQRFEGGFSPTPGCPVRHQPVDEAGGYPGSVEEASSHPSVVEMSDGLVQAVEESDSHVVVAEKEDSRPNRADECG